MYMSVRNIDVVSVPCEWSCIGLRDYIYIPDTHIHNHSQGTETTSIFLTHIYMTTHSLCTLWVVMYMCVRNIDVVSVPCEWSCIYVYREYRCCLCSLWVVMYKSVRNIDVHNKEQRQHRYSWHTYTWPLTRNKDYIYIPDTHIHDHSQGTETTSIFLTDIYIYMCQEYRCSLCSLWVVMYMCVRNIDVVSVPCEWSCIYVSGI
jgi:hypothetical protein